jgi:flagellar basal body-associated protein FliL
MTIPRNPDRPEARDRTGDSKRSLLIWLAVLALILTILMVVIFTWWQREGEQTEEDDVTHREMVEHLRGFDDYLLVA